MSSPTLLHRAETIYDTSRAICHAAPQQVTPPQLYDILGNLDSGYGHLASQVLDHIARAAAETARQVPLTHDAGDDPAQALREAVDLIQQASAKANEVGQLLSAAQHAIAQVGYQPTT